MAFLDTVDLKISKEELESKGFKQTILPFIAIFKKPATVLLLVSIILVNMSFSVAIAFTPDRGTNLGLYLDQTSYLLSMMGICNSVGKIGFGRILDRFRDQAVSITAGLMVVNGGIVLCSAFLTDFIGQAVYACIFGLTFGVFISSIVVVLQVGLKK